MRSARLPAVVRRDPRPFPPVRGGRRGDRPAPPGRGASGRVAAAGRAGSAAPGHARAAPAGRLLRSRPVRGKAMPTGPIDLVVSAGGRTLAANVRGGGPLPLPNVFPVPAAIWVTRVRPRVADLSDERSAAVLAAGAEAFAGRSRGCPPPRPLALRTRERQRRWRCWWGPVPHANFAPADWSALAALMRATAATGSVRFVLSTSRRTPDAALRWLEPVARDPAVVSDWIDWRSAGPGSIGRALAADGVLVTADSMSMICEAVAMRRPTVVLSPAIRRPARDDAALAPLLSRAPPGSSLGGGDAGVSSSRCLRRLSRSSTTHWMRSSECWRISSAGGCRSTTGDDDGPDHPPTAAALGDGGSSAAPSKWRATSSRWGTMPWSSPPRRAGAGPRNGWCAPYPRRRWRQSPFAIRANARRWPG